MLSKASSIKKVVTHAGGYTVLTCIRMHDLDKNYYTQVMSIFTNDHERTESHSNYSVHLRVVQLLLKPQNESDKDGKVHSACFGKVELPRGCLLEFLTADLAHGVQRRIISLLNIFSSPEYRMELEPAPVHPSVRGCVHIFKLEHL